MNALILNRFFAVLLLFASQLGLADAAAKPKFTLIDLIGKRHQLADYQGKWVLVNYWATWCPPCLEEIPDLVNLYDQRSQKDLMVLGVVFDYENVKSVKTFVDDMLMSYPIVLGDDAVAAQIGAATALPITYIYNPKGELVKLKRGLITKQYIEAIIGSAQ